MEKEKLADEFTISISEEEGCRKTLSIEVSPERFEKEKEKVARDLRKKVSLPGFRKGKVPYDIVRRRFDEEIKSEAIKSVVPEAYQYAVERWNLKTVGDPVFREIDDSTGDALKFKVDVEVVPEFELSGYRGVEVTEEEVTVTDEEVESVIDRLREQQATLEKVSRPAQESDVVVIDYAPLDDEGNVQEDKLVKDYAIQLGNQEVFAVFEEAILGKSVGDSEVVEISYPDDYKPEHLAGKKVKYRFTLKEIKEKVLPPLDDDFVKKVNPEFKTVDDLKNDIERSIMEEKSKEAERRKEAEAIDRIISSNPFDVPRSMVELYKRRLYEEDEKRRRSMGLGPEQDEEKRRELDEMFEKIAEREIKRYFIIEKIAEQENVQITDEDVEKEIEELIARSPSSEKQIRAYFKKGGENYSRLKDTIKEKKVFEIILG